MTWRTELIALLPWVRLLKHPQVCQGYTSMSGRRRRDPALREEKRCRAPAYWRFTSLKNAQLPAPNGVYCYHHLVSRGIYGSMEEHDRTERWFMTHLDVVNEVRTRAGWPAIPTQPRRRD